MNGITKNSMLECHERIKPFIHNTPILSSTLINEQLGLEIFFKCENFQKMGAFKMRGAANAILQLSPAQKQKGVVTHSSGNFAQAVSLSARNAGVKAFIVMPSNAPSVKKAAVKGYGGQITECEPTIEAREKAANEFVHKYGATLLHPSNDIPVIEGQGTAAMELLKDQLNLDYIFTPVGGGGLIAGTAMAALYFGVNCKVIGGEPEQADDAYRSLISGEIEINDTAITIADGLRTNLGDNNFPIIQNLVERIILVSEEEIVCAMRLIWERLKIVCEASSAVPFAALIKQKEQFQGKKVGIIISGGNVDLNNMPF